MAFSISLYYFTFTPNAKMTSQNVKCCIFLFISFCKCCSYNFLLKVTSGWLYSNSLPVNICIQLLTLKNDVTKWSWLFYHSHLIASLIKNFIQIFAKKTSQNRGWLFYRSFSAKKYVTKKGLNILAFDFILLVNYFVQLFARSAPNRPSQNGGWLFYR